MLTSLRSGAEFTHFANYAQNDSKILLDALLQAREYIFKEYSVDFMDSVSTSSLAMRVFRTGFLDSFIPTLTQPVDSLVRSAYFSGACDVYKKFGTGLYYYDINSLYPYAMINKLPGAYLRTVYQLSSLDDFFGFVQARVTYDGSKGVPLLPLRTTTGVSYPTGT